MAADEEKDAGTDHYVPGFGSFANFVASDDDHSTSVYKTFDRLAARDLLYYQAELLELEALLDQYDREDAADADPRHPNSASAQAQQILENSRDWLSFRQSAEEPTTNGLRWKKRLDLILKIRATLKEYREALIANAEVLSLSRPSKQTMTALSNTFHSRLKTQRISDDISEIDPVLLGSGSQLFPTLTRRSKMPSTDHVSLKRVPEPDFLTYFLKTYCSSLFRTRSRPPPTQGLTHISSSQVRHYSIERLNFTASFITTLLSAVLLFLPIYILYHVSSNQPGLTLGLIALFTCLFAGTIALVTGARRAEIFGACAGYAAVLVVFVSGDFANGNSGGSGGN